MSMRISKSDIEDPEKEFLPELHTTLTISKYMLRVLRMFGPFGWIFKLTFTVVCPFCHEKNDLTLSTALFRRNKHSEFHCDTCRKIILVVDRHKYTYESIMFQYQS